VPPLATTHTCSTLSVLCRYWLAWMPLTTWKKEYLGGNNSSATVSRTRGRTLSGVLTDADIASLQQPHIGTFAGDEWGETDTRFLYGALNALSLLGLMHLVDVRKAVEHIQSCANFDGGFGTGPGAESHAGQVFTCVGALAIADRLDLVDIDKLGGWLSERQLPNGGMNGRPEKLEDVCYSWWVVSSLAMIGRIHWIDGDKLAKFILSCQVCRNF